MAAIRATWTPGRGLTDERELHLFVRHDPRGWLAGLPERFADDYRSRYSADRAVPAMEAADAIAAFCDGRPTVVGAVPHFDTERITRQWLEPWGIPAPWHYHLVDIENVVVGYLRGLLVCGAERPAAELAALVVPPFDSHALSRAVGVEPGAFERHTAMGDVRWVRAQWDAVMRGWPH